MGFDVKKKYSLIVKLMVLILVVASAGPFFLKDKNGRPFMSFSKIKTATYLKYIELKHLLKLDTISTADSDKIVENYTPPDDREYTEMYQYRDDKGVLHFTDIKPKAGQYKVLYMPVSKEKTVGKKIDGMIETVFSGKKKKKTIPQVKMSDGEKKKGQVTIISRAKQMFQKAAEQYKEAPNALENAKAVKQQVEDAYRDREKQMKEGS